MGTPLEFAYLTAEGKLLVRVPAGGVTIEARRLGLFLWMAFGTRPTVEQHPDGTVSVTATGCLPVLYSPTVPRHP